MINFVSISKNKNLDKKCCTLINNTLMKWDIFYKYYSFNDNMDKENNKKIKEVGKYVTYILDATTVKNINDIINHIRNVESDYISFIIIIDYKNIFSYKNNKYDFHTLIIKNEKELIQMLSFGLSHILSMLTDYKENITFKSEGSIIKIPYQDILYIEKNVNSKDCSIVCRYKKKYLIKSTISYLEKKLTNIFIKTHRSGLVNKSNISQIDFNNSKIIFKDGSSCYLLSRSKKRQIKELLSKQIKKITE